jgi:alpha(1,3/1,4) fucosyltransferase
MEEPISTFIGHPSLKRIKIDFCDFWSSFNKFDNYFVRLLQQEYYLEITNRPDFLIYSTWGNQHKKYKCTKIFYTGENVRPNFWKCDYAFTFDYLNDKRNYRLLCMLCIQI